MTLRNEELITLNRNMYLYLNAGYSFEKVLNMIIDKKICSKKIINSLIKVKNDIDCGKSISEGFKNTKVIPVYMVQIINIGEESGRLCDIIKSLWEYYEEKKQRDKAVISTISYPLFIIIISFMLFLTLILFFVPMMNNTFSGFKIDESHSFRILLEINRFLTVNWSFILITIILSVSLILISFIKKNKIAYFILNKFILIKSIYYKLYSMKTVYFIYILLNNGVHIDRSIDLLIDMQQDCYIKEKLFCCRQNMTKGLSINLSLKSSNLFSKDTIDIISVGEDTAQLEKSLFTSYTIQKENFNRSFAKFLAILQPGVILFLGGMIFMIIYSVMCPVLDSMGNF